jgi:hypothetical protein
VVIETYMASSNGSKYLFSASANDKKMISRMEDSHGSKMINKLAEKIVRRFVRLKLKTPIYEGHRKRRKTSQINDSTMDGMDIAHGMEDSPGTWKKR